MEELILTQEMVIVFCFLALAIILFVFDLLRVDLVGMLMMVALPLSGVVTPNEALAGLSSNAVVSIIAVMIIGAGLNRTGVMNLVAAQLIKVAGTSEKRIISIVSATVSFLSSFMQNIGAVALFLPATMRISRQLNIPASRILMPMGFCAITGGCLTLVGSSPLIMLNDLMASWWKNNPETVHGAEFEPLGLLSVTPMGAALVVAILLYFLVLGRKLLPEEACDLDEKTADRRLQEIYGEEVGEGFEIQVPYNFEPQTLGQLELRPQHHVTVVGVAKDRGNRKDLSPTKELLVEPGDSLWVMSSAKNIKKASEKHGWRIKDKLQVFDELNYPEATREKKAVKIEIIPMRNNGDGVPTASSTFTAMYAAAPVFSKAVPSGINPDKRKTVLQSTASYALSARITFVTIIPKAPVSKAMDNCT